MFNANAKTKGNGSMAGRARDAGVAAAKAAAASKAAQAAATAAQTAASAAAAGATSAAQSAAQGVNIAAQNAAAGVGKGVRQSVYSARGWAAPLLDNAAEYTTATLAPKVSSALHGAASQVRPEDKSRRTVRSIVTWSALGAAVFAALGAVGVLVKKRYQDAMAADTEAEAEGAPGPADATAESAGTTTSTDAGVNGRVSASGW